MCAAPTPLLRPGRKRCAGGGCGGAGADCGCTKLLLLLPPLLGPWYSPAVDLDRFVDAATSSTFIGAEMAVVSLVAACEPAAAAAAATRDEASSMRFTITSCIARAADSIARASHSASVRSWLTVDWWFLWPSVMPSPSANHTLSLLTWQKYQHTTPASICTYDAIQIYRYGMLIACNINE